MTELPVPFQERMRTMLGEEYTAFAESYEMPRFRGLRVNTGKISPDEFEKISPFPVSRIPWTENGFFYSNDVFPAQHPLYAAGVYYLQEPSAMTPASRLPVSEGDRVLDLCAAPGGKATELAAKLHGTGMLVANDISQARAKALLRNLELFGTKRFLVTNETPERLAEVFEGWFDKVLVDAPCSGEGMFRKNPEAAAEWSPEKVKKLAGQQKQITEAAVSMLCPDGWMLYSTCTFSAEENEQVIHALLEKHPELELCRIAGYEGFSEGRPEWADGDERLRSCVRIWPHKMEGEGHFLALLHKTDGNSSVSAEQAAVPGSAETEYRAVRAERTVHGRREDAVRPEQKRLLKKTGRKKNSHEKKERATASSDGMTKEKESLFRDFLHAVTDRETVQEMLRGGTADGVRLECRGDRAYLVTDLPYGVGGLHFLRNGLYIGEWKKNRFEPSQPLAMAADQAQLKAVLMLEMTDTRAAQFTRGETLLLTEVETKDLKNGWVLVCVDRFPLGWGKLAGQIVKNKYPSAWRAL